MLIIYLLLIVQLLYEMLYNLHNSYSQSPGPLAENCSYIENQTKEEVGKRITSVRYLSVKCHLLFDV